MKLNSCEGPQSFEEMYPSIVDDVLKNHFPAFVRTNSFMRRAAVAGLWLGLVTRTDTEAAGLLRGAIQRDLDPYDAAVAVAKGRGWVPQMEILGAEESIFGRSSS